MKGETAVNIKLMLDPEDPIRKSLESMGIIDDPDSKYLLIRRGGEVNYIAGKGKTSSSSLTSMTYVLSRAWDMT